MNEISSEKVITLKDLWDIFIRRIIVIGLVAVITVCGVFAFDRITYTPQYESTASMYIQREKASSASTTADAYNEIILALKVVNDCTYILKSRTVVDQVIDELDLDCSSSQLSGRISTENPENTRILEVTVQGNTPEEAKEIVDTLCRIGQKEIDEAMGFSSIKLYEEGHLPAKPSNKTGIVTFGLIGIAAAVVAYGVFVLMFLLDDRIRTEEDIEHILGLSVLGEIPDLNDSRKKQNAYSAYGKKLAGRKMKASGKHERRS